MFQGGSLGFGKDPDYFVHSGSLFRIFYHLEIEAALDALYLLGGSTIFGEGLRYLILLKLVVVNYSRLDIISSSLSRVSIK